MTAFSPFEPAPASHPDRLAVIAAARGVGFVAPGSARVLELGCGDGTNVVPLAYHRRAARFVGLEGSPVHAGAARAAVERLGLDNVTIVEGGLEAVRGERFDFVILPGVLSNVSEEVARASLALTAEVLTERGLVYADHLGASGRALAAPLRELLRRTAARLDTVAERLRAMRALLEVLDDDAFDAGDPHVIHARCELQFARSLSDAALMREVLAPHRRPYTPSAFRALLRAHGLEVVDLAWEPSLNRRKVDALRAAVAGLTGDPAEAEDLVDWVAGTRRRAIVARRADGAPGGGVDELLPHVLVAGQLETRLPDVLLDPGMEATFVARGGALVRTSIPLGKALLVALRDAWPEGRRFGVLIEEASALLARAGLPPPTEEAIRQQAKELVSLHAVDAISLCAGTSAHASDVPPTPRVSPLTAWQASRTHLLTDAQHRIVAVDELTRRLVLELDGTRDAAALESAILGWVEAGEIALAASKDPAPAARIVERALAALGKAGLLTSGGATA